MRSEDFLKGVAHDMRIRAQSKKAILKRIQGSIGTESPLLSEISTTIRPKARVQTTIWNRVKPHITKTEVSALHDAATSVTPNATLGAALRDRILERIKAPATAAVYSTSSFKWVAAFIVFGLFVRMSPLLFIASSTVAESQHILLPTYGEVSVSIGDLWQTVDSDITLEPGMRIRTHGGEASLVFGDYGVIRMDEKTTVQINDLSGRLETASEILPMVTLFTGKIWVQGLLPQELRPLEIATSAGHISVNEGSVSIAEDDFVNIEVYDRSAVVHKHGNHVYLSAGERSELYEDSNVLLVKKIPTKWYQYAWADQNLQRDAVHRHDIAQVQHERRIAQAGILPTSPLYPVKRFAEAVDVLLTLDGQSRVEKQLRSAETRLNEAAALIYHGEDADVSLKEYKKALQAIASGDADDSLAEFLVQRALAQSTANISAALPGDESYAIKKTVLETSASVEAQGALLLDGLAVMLRSADSGNTDMVRSVWSDLHPHLVMIENEDSTLSPAMYKEAKTLLTFLASTLHTASNRGVSIDPELLDDLALYLPIEKVDEIAVQLSEEEIMYIVSNIKENIFIYSMTQSRVNQFILEMRALASHPDQGRILRRLASILPEGPENFPERVYKEIVKLRWERAAQETI